MRIHEKSWSVLALVLAGILVQAGCSDPASAPSEDASVVDADPGFEVQQSDLPRRPGAEAPVADLWELSAGIAEFALDVDQGLSEDETGNRIFSPLSISLALAMTYAGARGDTAAQMADVLHFSLPDERLHAAFNALDQTLASRAESALPDTDIGFALRIANALWCQRGESFLPAYLDVLAEHYGAGVHLLDFAEPEVARLTINAWVSEQTEGRIEELIPPGKISARTRLVLTNSIYFLAAWKHPFSEHRTADEPFHLQDGTAVSVPLMHQTNSFQYAQADGVQVVELPYERRELAMVVILPAQGRFQEVATSLDGSRLDALLGDLRARNVVLTLPRFTYESSYSLKDVLVALGMVDAFGAADFSGMNGVGGLFILDVLHRAFIAVDEEGTEATASTAVIANIDAGVPTDAEVPPPVTFTADRPFFFLIRDRPTRAILFMGRVEDPR